MLRPIEMLFPSSVQEASAELARLGDDAVVYSGGVELVLLTRLGFTEAGTFVDVKRIPGMGDLAAENGRVRIGATVTHRRVHSDDLVRERLPLLAQSASRIGNVRIRNQGTLGGNISFADPQSDPHAPLLVYDTTVTAESSLGRREIAFGDFLVGPYQTALEPAEIVTSIAAASLPGWGQRSLRFARFERPTLSTAVAVRVESGAVAEARVAVGCLGPRARRLPGLEARLAGARRPDVARLVDESRRELAELGPADDMLGSADYKLQLARVLVRRALDDAMEAAA